MQYIPQNKHKTCKSYSTLQTHTDCMFEL